MDNLFGITSWILQADLDADVRPDSRRDKPHVVDFLLPWNTAKCAPGGWFVRSLYSERA